MTAQLCNTQANTHSSHASLLGELQQGLFCGATLPPAERCSAAASVLWHQKPHILLRLEREPADVPPFPYGWLLNAYKESKSWGVFTSLGPRAPL